MDHTEISIGFKDMADAESFVDHIQLDLEISENPHPEGGYWYSVNVEIGELRSLYGDNYSQAMEGDYEGCFFS